MTDDTKPPPITVYSPVYAVQPGGVDVVAITLDAEWCTLLLDLRATLAELRRGCPTLLAMDIDAGRRISAGTVAGAVVSAVADSHSGWVLIPTTPGPTDTLPPMFCPVTDVSEDAPDLILSVTLSGVVPRILRTDGVDPLPWSVIEAFMAHTDLGLPVAPYEPDDAPADPFGD